MLNALVKDVPIYTLLVTPNYNSENFGIHVTADSKADEFLRTVFQEVGAQIDAAIKANYYEKRLVLRSISSFEHQSTLDELLTAIIATGTDRLDSSIPGRGYDALVDCDLFGKEFTIDDSFRYGYLSRLIVYEKTLGTAAAGKVPNLVLIYDATQLLMVSNFNPKEGKDRKDAFKFRNPAQKKQALLGVIKLTN